MRLSEQLVACAKARLTDKGTVSEGNLRRAQSDLYYALFHAICDAASETLISGQVSHEQAVTYSVIYRSHDHACIERKCKALRNEEKWAKSLKRFATLFFELKNKRERADYYPLAQFKKSEILNDYRQVKDVISDFWQIDRETRIQFALTAGEQSKRRKPGREVDYRVD